MLALVENLQRRDLDYIEEAEGLQKLMQQYHLSQEQAARRIGKSQSAVANKLRILRHPPSVLQALRENHLTERHARALLKLPDEAERLRVIGLIAQGEWTVAKTEQYIDSLLAPRTPQRRELGGFVLLGVPVLRRHPLHRPPARSRPRRGRRRQPRAAGDRAGDRPDHPDPEIQSAAFPQPVTGGGIFLQPGRPIFPRVLRFANDMKSDIRPSLSDMAFCPNLRASGRPESHIFLAETKTFQFANPRKYGIVCICLKNLKV